MNEEQKYEHRTFEEKPRTALVEVRREALGGNDALVFASKLDELRESGFTHIIADLGNVKLMNSSGLGMLVSALSSLRKYEVRFSLVSAPDKIMELLKMTRLDQVFEIFKNAEEALAS